MLVALAATSTKMSSWIEVAERWSARATASISRNLTAAVSCCLHVETCGQRCRVHCNSTIRYCGGLSHASERGR